MIRRRTRRLAIALVLLCLAAACGASSRMRALRVNLVALNTARDAVLAISREREKQIYDSCNPPTCTKEEGHTRVEALQKVIDVVVDAIDAAYKAVHDAGLLGDAKSAADASAASSRALDLYEQLKEKP